MKDVLKSVQFETKTSCFEQVNQEFMKVKINVCYAGKNRNYSIIEKEVLEKMAKTIYGVPVVGEYDEDNKKFKGHGGKLEISDDGFKFIDTTIPYGFVDPTTPYTYEKILEHDGMTYKEYLTVFAYLWKGKYPELVEVFEKETVKQSMEITVDSGEWDDNWDYFNINDAHFTALCLLGVEPCFESSKATNKFSHDDAKSQYKEMMDAFKKFTLEEVGGENVPTDEVNTVEETDVVEEFETQETEVVEEIQEEQAEVVVEEVSYEPQDDSAEESATDEPEQEVSTDESEIEGDVDTDKVEEDVVDYELLYQTLSTEHQELQENLLAITTQFEALKVENERLVKFENEVLTERKKVEVDSVLGQFGVLEGFAGFDELKEQAYSLELDELRTKLFALLGQRSFAMIQEETKVESKQSSAIIVEKQNTPIVSNTTFGILDKYLPKK